MIGLQNYIDEFENNNVIYEPVCEMIERYLVLRLCDFEALPEQLNPTPEEYLFATRMLKCLVVSCDETGALSESVLRQLMSRDEWVWVLLFREWYAREDAANELKSYVFHCFTDMVACGSDVNLTLYLTTNVSDQYDEVELPNNVENHERFLTCYRIVRGLYSQIYDMEFS